MDNENQPGGQAPHDPSSSQLFRFTPGWPGRGQAPGYPQRPGHAEHPAHGQPPGYGPPPWQPGRPIRAGRRRPGRRGRLLRWAGSIAAVALLSAGGTAAGLALAGGSAPANPASAVALNDALASAAAPASHACGLAAASAPPGSQARAGHCRPAHLMRLVKGMYGEVAFHGAAGTVMFAFERGTVTSAGGGHLVVRAASGTTWIWNLASDPVIRYHGKKLPGYAPPAGARVFVAGRVSGSAKDARLVIIRAVRGGHARNPAARPSASSSAA